MSRKLVITRLQRSKFMASLSEWGIREVACKDSGLSLATVTKLISEDADFAIEFEEAKASAIGSLAKEAIRRGRDGWEDPLFVRGAPMMTVDPDRPGEQKIATIRRFDPKLLQFALAALDPGRFGVYAGQKQDALPEDMRPDPEPTPDEDGPEKPIL